MRNTRDTRDARGPDERRVAHLLQRNGVGPDALDARNAAAVDQLRDDLDAAEQTVRVVDWWKPGRPDIGAPPPPVEDEEELVPILTSGRDTPRPARPEPADQPEPEPTEPIGPGEEPPAGPSGRFAPASGYWPRPHWPAVPEPVQRVALSPKTRQFLSLASAAGAGYVCGLVPWEQQELAECTAHAGVTAALVVGVGAIFAVAHLWDRRTRHWWWLLAWAARIPLASALLALGLYAPGTT